MVWVLQTFFSSFIKSPGQFLTQPFNQVLLTICPVTHNGRHSEYGRKPYTHMHKEHGRKAETVACIPQFKSCVPAGTLRGRSQGV